MNIFKYLLSVYLGIILFFASNIAHSAIIISPQKTPAAAPAYTHIPNEWQVASVYGPRNPGAVGSKLHKGIDYSQAAGNADKGLIIKAKLAGSISSIETGSTAKYISITSEQGNLTYIHIFDDTSLPITLANKNITTAGYSKVTLDNVIRNDPKKGTCGAIFFYKKKVINNISKDTLDKLLTPAACSKAGASFKVKAQTQVAAEEDIAPMGTSLPPNGISAHLHLQINSGANSLLTIMKHDFGLIPNATQQFEVKLQYNKFTPDIMTKMSEGLGFAIKVSENSLVPDLDAIKVSLEGTDLASFDFGGVTAKPVNMNNILPGFLLERGSVKPTIKPVAWTNSTGDGSGTPRVMYFFVPYPNLKKVTSGTHTLNVEVKTVDKIKFNYKLNFTVVSGCAVGNKGPAGGIIFYVKPGSTDASCHGLEAAPADVPGERDNSGDMGFTWGCWGWDPNLNTRYTWTIVGSTSTAIGTGTENTKAIIADCGTKGGAGNGNFIGRGTTISAAAAAKAYTLNGFSDWYLPSKDELNLLYVQKIVVGGFVNNYYWSSSENSSWLAWFQSFGNGNSISNPKYYALPVRAVRSF